MTLYMLALGLRLPIALKFTKAVLGVSSMLSVSLVHYLCLIPALLLSSAEDVGIANVAR